MRCIDHSFDFDAELSVYDALSAATTGLGYDRLVALRTRIEQAYLDYAAAATAVDVQPWANVPPSDGQALKGCYDLMRSGACRELGARILARSSVCCLCGHNPAGQLDHHLPKSVFPEFASLGMNLVPVCADCNMRKRDKYRRPGGAGFVHAYKDSLPTSEKYLQVRLILLESTIVARYELIRPGVMSTALFETLEHHFAILGLGDRFGQLAAEVLLEKLDPLYAYNDDGGAAAVSSYLGREARGAELAYGLNHWKTALLAAMSSDAAFCAGAFARLGPRGFAA